MPTKAAYERWEEYPDEEFDFLLCLKLGWQSVAQMRRGLSAREWGLWKLYFLRRAQDREMARMRAEG